MWCNFPWCFFSIDKWVLTTQIKFCIKAGYRLSSNKSIECQDGKWTGETPECTKLLCNSDRNLVHGQIIVEQDDVKFELYEEGCKISFTLYF